MLVFLPCWCLNYVKTISLPMLADGRSFETVVKLDIAVDDLLRDAFDREVATINARAATKTGAVAHDKTGQTDRPKATLNDYDDLDGSGPQTSDGK